MFSRLSRNSGPFPPRLMLSLSVHDVISDEFFFPALPPLLFPTYFHCHTFYIAYTKKYWVVSTATYVTKRSQMGTFSLPSEHGASSLLGKNVQIHLLQQAVRNYHRLVLIVLDYSILKNKQTVKAESKLFFYTYSMKL